MFKEKDEDVIIFEMATSLKQHPHMYLECVPIPKETGELAPIYFKVTRRLSISLQNHAILLTASVFDFEESYPRMRIGVVPE